MSRCFSFPPLGYEKNGLSGAALIEWFEREREKALKERRKEKKRAKKEKRREESKEHGEIENKKQSQEKPQKDARNKQDYKEGCHSKRRDGSTEPLEKSDLSEEHGQPNNEQKAYDSSDNTQNSNKRKNHSSSSDRHDYCEGSVLCNGLSCSMSGRTEIVAHKKARIASRQEQHCSTSGRTDILGLVDLQWRDLFENWAPPPSQIESTIHDMEWLFETKQARTYEEKRFKASDGALCHIDLSANIYALPYSIPY